MHSLYRSKSNPDIPVVCTEPNSLYIFTMEAHWVLNGKPNRLDKILKKKYKIAIAEDEILYESLKTNDGRTKYWEALWHDAKKSDLVSLFEECKSLSGNVIECGVWRGRTTKLLCRSLKETKEKKIFYACDSFEGFGDSSLGDEDVKLFRPLTRLKKKFTAAQDVPAKLDKFFNYFDINGVCLKGFFDETLDKIAADETFCFAHIDCDAYKPHLECLEYIYPRLTKGGCIVFDDYGAKAWPGAKKAVDEFFADKVEDVKFRKDRGDGAWFIQKA